MSEEITETSDLKESEETVISSNIDDGEEKAIINEENIEDNSQTSDIVSEEIPIDLNQELPQESETVAGEDLYSKSQAPENHSKSQAPEDHSKSQAPENPFVDSDLPPPNYYPYNPITTRNTRRPRRKRGRPCTRSYDRRVQYTPPLLDSINYGFSTSDSFTNGGQRNSDSVADDLYTKSAIQNSSNLISGESSQGEDKEAYSNFSTEESEMVGKGPEKGKGEKKKILEMMTLQFNSSDVPGKGGPSESKRGRRTSRLGRPPKRQMQNVVEYTVQPSTNEPSLASLNPITHALKKVRKETNEEFPSFSQNDESDLQHEGNENVSVEGNNQFSDNNNISKNMSDSSKIAGQKRHRRNALALLGRDNASPHHVRGMRRGRGRSRGRAGSLSPAVGRESPRSESSIDSFGQRQRRPPRHYSLEEFPPTESDVLSPRGRGRGRPSNASFPFKSGITRRARGRGIVDRSNRRSATPVTGELDEFVSEETTMKKIGRTKKVDDSLLMPNTPPISLSVDSPGGQSTSSNKDKANSKKKKKKHFKGLKYSFVKKKKKPKLLKVLNAQGGLENSQETESLASEDVDGDSFDSSSQDMSRRLLLLPGELDPYDPSAEFDDSQSEKSIPMSLQQQRRAFKRKEKEEEYEEDEDDEDEEVMQGEEEQGEREDNVEDEENVNWENYEQENEDNIEEEYEEDANQNAEDEEEEEEEETIQENEDEEIAQDEDYEVTEDYEIEGEAQDDDNDENYEVDDEDQDEEIQDEIYDEQYEDEEDTQEETMDEEYATQEEEAENEEQEYEHEESYVEQDQVSEENEGNEEEVEEEKTENDTEEYNEEAEEQENDGDELYNPEEDQDVEQENEDEDELYNPEEDIEEVEEDQDMYKSEEDAENADENFIVEDEEIENDGESDHSEEEIENEEEIETEEGNENEEEIETEEGNENEEEIETEEGNENEEEIETEEGNENEEEIETEEGNENKDLLKPKAETEEEIKPEDTKKDIDQKDVKREEEEASNDESVDEKKLLKEEGEKPVKSELNNNSQMNGDCMPSSNRMASHKRRFEEISGGVAGGDSKDKGEDGTRKSKRLNRVGASAHPLAIGARSKANNSQIQSQSDADVADPSLTNVLCRCRDKTNPKAVNLSGELYCQALDSFDGRIIGCCNIISNFRYLRVSGKIPFMLLCSIHRQRIRRHNCCPGCGLFCTQGIFFECRWNKMGSRHYYHKLCGLLINGITLCPHCGTDQPPVEVHLELKLSRKPVIYLKQHQEKKGFNSSARMSLSKTLLVVPVINSDEGNSDLPCIELPDGRIISPSKLPVGLDRDRLEAAISVIKMGKAINVKPAPKGIYWSCKQGDLEKLLHVLVNGVNANAKVKEYGNQCGLHTATTHGCLPAIHILVSAGAALDPVDSQLQTPLMIAIMKNHNEIVNYLVHAGSNLNAKTQDGMTCLHLAAKSGNYEACRHILDSGRLSRHSINIQDEGGWTPLVWASENRCINVVKILLDRGANPQICDVEQNTALHWAAFSGSTHICSMVLDRGCSLRSMNAIGDTPLHIAARQNHVEAVVLLLARGALLDIQNSKGQTPLDCTFPESDVFLQLTLNKELKNIAAKNGIRNEKILSSDIAAGKESVPVPIVNGADDDGLPKDYIYIAENCEALNVNIDRTMNSLKWCECEDGCNTDSCICSQLNFQCWYDPEGKLLADFNYADPPMIFECNRACGCNKLSCHNRVVQHGMTAHLQLFKTVGKGWGVRALKDIEKGSYVCEYVGEIITDLEADLREDDSYLFDLDNRDSETFCIDARQYGNVARFINHLCDANLTPVKVFVDHQDLVFPRIAFFANRNIEADEELGFDYGEKFWIIKYKHFTCMCSSKTCKYSSETIQTTLEAYNKKIKEHSQQEKAVDSGSSHSN